MRKFSKMTSSQEFNFQFYFNLVKQKEIAWHVFVKLMEDLSYSDVDRLKYLNANLLTELTISHSDMDQLKYLNVILMNKFKDSIKRTDIEKSEVSHDSHESNEDNIEFSEKENIKVDHDGKIEGISCDSKIEISENENLEVGYDMSDEIITEISIPSKEERHQDLNSQIDDKRKCHSCGKSFTAAQTLKKHIYTVHEGHKDYECDTCDKTFSQAEYLKKHIHRTHEGHKNSCKSSGKSFFQVSNLKAHTRRVHSCHKDFLSKPKNDHKENKTEAEIIKSTVESQETNKIKQEALELEDEMPIFESDSTYLNNEIKQEIVAQSIVDFRYDIKREESTLDDMPNFEMDSTYLDKGASTYYVTSILAIFDPPLPPVIMCHHF